MITLTGETLTLDSLIAISRDKQTVSISETAKKNSIESRKSVEKILEDRHVVYGINTGFGSLSDVRVGDSDLGDLQHNLLRSHACGSGELLDQDIIRSMMALRVNALIKGYSGVRYTLINQLVTYLNKDIVPVVYAQGSLGASGDLVPLAHMALPLIGEGEVFDNGVVRSASEVLGEKGIAPIKTLEAKEGLALINGTQAMTSIGAHTLYDAYKTLAYSGLSSGMTFEALDGIEDVFNAQIHAIRPHKGQIQISELMRHILKGSTNTTHQGQDHVQDAYSLRCIPQVHGATLDALHHVHYLLDIEMNSVTDNPLIFKDSFQALSAGNFHGQPLAMAFDYMTVAISEMANISERRLERLVNAGLNKKYPPFLTVEKGRNSGFMIVQYTAASLVSENKSLSHPASVDSIPSSANQEDHVSMGTIAARKAQKVLAHTRKVVALELFTSAQAIDFKGAENLSPIMKNVHTTIRKVVPFIEEDTIMKPHMDTVENLLIQDAFEVNQLEERLWPNPSR